MANDVTLKRKTGPGCLAIGADVYAIAADGTVTVPHALADALLASPVHGFTLAPQPPQKPKGK